MAQLALQDLNASTGLTPTFNPVNSSDTFANDGKTSLQVVNASGATITVTVVSQLTTADDSELGQVALADLVFSIPAGGRRLLPFLKPARFNDANGNVTVNYSATATVTSAAIRLPRPL